jgi:hypothetical protein
MRTDCIVKLSKLQIFELNTLVQKETSGHVEGKPPPSDKRSLHMFQRTLIIVHSRCRAFILSSLVTVFHAP